MTENLIPIPWPKKGIDRTLPESEQPPLTCTDARNVRSLAVSGNRMGGGRRAGLARAVTAAATGGGRINGLFAVQRQAQTTAPALAVTREDVYERWTNFGQGLPAPNDSMAGASSLRGLYVMFRRNRNTGAVTGITGAAAPTAGVRHRIYGDSTYGNPVLQLFPNGSDALGADLCTGCAVHFPTTNDMEVRLLGTGQATAQFGGIQLTGCGPFIRGAVNLGSMIVAYLEWSGITNRLRLVVERLDANGDIARLATGSVEFLLSNSATVNSTGATIRIRATTTTIIASASIGTQTDTLTIPNADLSAQNRAGVLCLYNTGTPTFSDGTAGARRNVSYLRYTRIRPAAGTLVTECMAPAINPLSGNRHVIPAGFAASYSALTGTTTPTVVTGANGSGSQNDYPRVDTTSNLIQANAAAMRTRDTHASVFAATGDNAGITDAVIEATVSNGTTAAAPELAFPVFRMTADQKNFVRVQHDRIFTGATTNGQSSFSLLTVLYRYTTGGGTTDFGTTSSEADTDGFGMPIISLGALVRWRHLKSGSNWIIRLEQNGLALWEQTYTASVGWAPAASTFSGVEMGRLGVDLAVRNGGTDVPRLGGFRIMSLMTPNFVPVTPGFDLVACQSDGIRTSPLTAGGSWTTLTGSAFVGTLPIGFQFGNRIYAVDGQPGGSRVLNWTGGRVEDWAGVTGTDRDGCRVCCLYRGRAVIARQENAVGAWYMSRVGNLEDWDTSATDTAVRAVAGSDPTIGQPADEVVGLVPWFDDYLIFLCRSSIYALAGDPGAGGQVDIVTPGFGGVGPRAFCFDEKGNLYFLSTGGLCRIQRGSLNVEELAEGRLTDILEEINPATSLVQMAYDVKRKAVHIFITPTDGTTVGVHVVWVRSLNEALGGELWLDEYPLAMQPWGVAQIQADAQDDREILLAGSDGVVRRFSDTATSDDGTAIDAWIKLPPVRMEGGQRECMASELSVCLSTASGVPLDWRWRVGESPQAVDAQAVGATAAASGSFTTAGDRRDVGLRVAGAAHQLLLRQTATAAGFAVQDVFVRFKPCGRRRNT